MRDNRDAGERVAADFDEAGIDPDGVDTEHVGPHTGNRGLQRRRRIKCGGGRQLVGQTETIGEAHALHLAGRSRRQLIDDEDALWDLVRCQSRRNE